jgi:hypothetical protein
MVKKNVVTSDGIEPTATSLLLTLLEPQGVWSHVWNPQGIWATLTTT